ncbi:hypothetical protein AK812_SmicGene48549, partial [Symbiodinium microadriaticum]
THSSPSPTCRCTQALPERLGQMSWTSRSPAPEMLHCFWLWSFQ